MTKILQLLRNSSLVADRAAANTALTAKLAELSDGEIVLSRYGDGSKALVGIAYVNGDTRHIYIIDTDAVPSDVQNAIDTLKTELTEKITAEETARTEADSTLQSNIDAEATRAKAAEDTIEASVGLNADGTLVTPTGNYTSGATTIAGEISALDSQVKTNSDAIAAETSRATTAENTLQNNIDAEETARKAVTGQDDDTYAANDSANYIADATSLNDADTKLDAAIKELSDEIDTTNYVKDIEQALKTDENYSTTEADVYTVTHGDDTADSLQLTFTPISPLSLTIPETIGDFEQGTYCSELNGKPLSEILDSILFKTIYPTITKPSGSISFASGFTNNAILIAGATAPTDSNMTYSFNQGSVVVSDGVTANKTYVGAASGCSYVYKYAASAANTNAGVAAGGTSVTDVALTNTTTLSLGTYTYKGTISYAAGPTMTTSKGTSPNPMPTTNAGDVTNPHAAGTLTTSYNLTLNVTLPVYIDNTATGTFTQQTLQTWGSKTYTANMAATTAANPIQIKTPRKLSSVNSYNAVSGKYDVAQLSNFTMSEVTETINSVNHTYYLYAWAGGALSAVSMQVTTY